MTKIASFGYFQRLVFSNFQNFSKLFPLRKINHHMKVRNSEKYLISPSHTKRYQDSAVPYLQGLLNKDHFDKKQRLKNLFEDKCSQKFLNFEN